MPAKISLQKIDPLLPTHIACDRMHRDYFGRKKPFAAPIFNPIVNENNLARSHKKEKINLWKIIQYLLSIFPLPF
jgi:hypothetical protein